MTVSTAQDELARQCKVRFCVRNLLQFYFSVTSSVDGTNVSLQEYDDLLLVCQQRLQAQGVPLYKFPFRSSEQILIGPSPKN